MQNNTKTYLLLALVLGVWGAIAYKMISGFSSDLPQATAQEFQNTFTPKAIAKVEPFTIKNIERDPFLGTLYKPKVVQPKRKAPVKLKPTQPTPQITFRGLIKQKLPHTKNASNQVFVVNINNKQYLLKKGQTADSVKVVSGNTNEIVVRYNKTSQKIKRQ